MSARLVTPNINQFPRFLKDIEAKWLLKVRNRFERERYAAEKTQVPNQKPTRYILSMFPYPSGRLHLGHVRTYTSGDILTRYSKLMSKNQSCQLNDFSDVVHPMGFDSFGLPAENAARERGLNPAVWTNANIRAMKQQLDSLALQFNWREATSNPSFYKWTQELFLKLMDAGLVYKSFAQVNWDPVDNTVLADEQVDEHDRSWRSGALVEKRFFRQWFIKVNAFTNAIWQGDEVDPETWRDILALQRGWIGTPSGWIFYIPVKICQTETAKDVLPVFTTQPELFASSLNVLLIAKDHWLTQVYDIGDGDSILNPFTGVDMRVRLTDIVGDLPPGTKATITHADKSQPVGEINGPDSSQSTSRQQILLQSRLNNFGGYYTSDKYRDWLISRQRFWGTPIPVTYCESCGTQGAPRESLPVVLPTISSIDQKVGSDSASSRATDELRAVPPIEKLAPKDWIETKCKSCGGIAIRECETFDTLFDSSWYFLRYAAEPTKDKPFDCQKVQPTWCYIGGKEHAAMHLFYARFVTHFLHSLGEINFREPFASLLVQGVVKGRTYKLGGRYLSKEEVSEASKNKQNLVVEYEKMSKSKGNGVDPQNLTDTYGIDATRFCLMSYANPRSERMWRSDEEEFREVLSYIRRVFLTVQQYCDIGQNLQAKGTGKVEELDKSELSNRRLFLKEQRDRASVDSIYHLQYCFQFRQFISVLHVLTTVLRNNLKNSAVYTEEYADALATLIVMLNPIMPHISEELWFHFSRSAINPLKFNPTSSYNITMQVADQSWPIPDDNYSRSRCFNKPVMAE